MTLVTFVIPVRHQNNARDWGALVDNLMQTVRSIANQTNPDWKGIIVANEGAQIPALPKQFSVHRVTFPPNDMHELNKGNKEAALDAFRYDKGRRVLSGMLAARDSRFFMIVDDDDLVSARIVQFAADNKDANGWTIDKGYLWDSGGKLMLAEDGFNHLCGTSLIVRADAYELPESFDAATTDWIKDMLGSHMRIGPVLENRGRALASLPFRGAVYRVAHAGSHSGASSVIRKHFLSRHALRKPHRVLSNLRRLKFVSGRIKNEFFGTPA